MYASKALHDVAAERQRQVQKKLWTTTHDDSHDAGELARAAAAYALSSQLPDDLRAGWQPMFWPWQISHWKPKSRREDLVRAGALILAEIERLDRREQTENGGQDHVHI